MIPAVSETKDADLVARSMAGERDAFAEIVSRYQSLICSLTYSATGDVARSEDLAQDTFVAAWKQLRTIRDPERLRSWLCGIARNIINNSIRKANREPAHSAQPLDVAGERPATELLPSEKLISSEESAIVWGALERIPESYREPLVLFYRENASIEMIATQLDLSQDAVKQRLSRGREMVREEVAAVVECALKRTRPGRMFTLAVMASLPAMVGTSAKAAILAAAGKAAAPAAKGVAAGAGLGAILGPLAGLAGGGFGAWASWQHARYQSQRDLIKRAGMFYLISGVLFTLGTVALRLVRQDWLRSHALAWGLGLGIWIFGYIFLVLIYSLWFTFKFRRITSRAVASGATPLPSTRWATKTNRWAQNWEGRQWQTRAKFLGLPLIDINFGSPGAKAPFSQAATSACAHSTRTARGWIALGERAYGVFFACGNIAIGGIAVGGLSAGILAFGGAGIGLCAIGGMAMGGFAIGGGAVGAFALGGMAAGGLAFGGGAFAVRAAKGGFACARDFAVGGKAFAAHANTSAATQYINSHWLFHFADWQMHPAQPWLHGHWFAIGIVALSLLLGVVMRAIGCKRRKASSQQIQ
ncbi:MAG TPA: sigma-70 family RNA polymerase sigma factor [Verrucomicrobiae bacterium]|nr:sigma-70 family RNA polymerase sigma factor [Verrucomicrobiae bacterium]